ncbi:MAG: tetratricopeptide repeat protein [Candidatus Acidiferrales bacterium]
MKSFVKFAACGALLGIFSGAGIAARTQTTRKRVPRDPAAVELNNLLATASQAMGRKDYAAAADNFERYLAKKPDDAAIHFQLGYAYTALDRLADAKTEYEKTVQLDPKMPQAYLNLGLTQLDSDPAAAVEPLQKAAELQPDDARPKFLLGVALERSGKPAEAVVQYQAAEKLDEKDFDTHFSLGRALLDTHRPADAEPEFRAALAIRPNDTGAHLGLANSLDEQKELEPAAAEFAAYLAAKPDDSAVRVERALLLADLGKNDEALAELDRAAAAGPEKLRALKLRSRIYFDKKQYDNAIAALQKAVVLSPQDQDVRARLGHVYLEKKDYPDAVVALVAAYKMNPAANDVLGDLVTAQYLNKNYSGALQGLDLLSRRQELPAGSWFIRATCYDRLGDTVHALDAYKMFLQLNKNENNDMYFEASARARTLTRELQNKKR